MRVASGVWRWRRNPLRRSTDLVEAWVALAAMLLIVLGAPLLGWCCGVLSDRALERAVHRQQQQRHATIALVVRTLPGPALSANPDGSPDGSAARSKVLANWKAADGSLHTGALIAGKRHDKPGDTLPIWTDGHGSVVNRPLDTTTARSHAVLAGVGAAVAAAGLFAGGRHFVVWRLVRRRYARLDRAWAKAGPDWGRTGTGS
ncbi:hypothetical protein [Streptomyces sp. NPDC050738]|uniref:Rv1733c family protein n=1 Tax=Streptomyces sp. NPDC050738 TaxID=3154744 RepID=UPI0034275285